MRLKSLGARGLRDGWTLLRVYRILHFAEHDVRIQEEASLPPNGFHQQSRAAQVGEGEDEARSPDTTERIRATTEPFSFCTLSFATCLPADGFLTTEDRPFLCTVAILLIVVTALAIVAVHKHHAQMPSSHKPHSLKLFHADTPKTSATPGRPSSLALTIRPSFQFTPSPHTQRRSSRVEPIFQLSDTIHPSTAPPSALCEEFTTNGDSLSPDTIGSPVDTDLATDAVHSLK